MWIIVCVWCIDNGEWFERLVYSVLMLLWIVQRYKNCHILFICVNMSFALFKIWLWQVLRALKKNENLKRIYHFEWFIACHDGYYVSRHVSRAAMVTIIVGRIVHRNRCMDKYVPYGSQTERQRVCITRSDMHHYTWHCIPLHCTYLIIIELDTVIRWSCNCLFAELLTFKYWACYWGYVICWSVVEDM